jgi:aldose 1-epimerase
MVSESAFEGSYKDKPVSLKRIKNAKGTVISITNYGARVVEWIYKGVDVVLGFSGIHEYLSSTEFYYGAIIGRYANRIANSRFTLNGTEYGLQPNVPPNHLHGGIDGFHNQVWDINETTPDSIRLSYLSKDGEEGYPGNLHVQLKYTLTDQDELRIEFKAETDATTILNLTNHAFFNLNGEGEGTILDHELMINADSFTPVTDQLVPDGTIASVSDTVFDFRKAKKIGDKINDDVQQLIYGKGYDHNYVLNKEPGNFAARVKGNITGIMLEVYTDQPGMQLYTGNFMQGNEILKCGMPDDYRTAFCLETQHFPDSPNQPDFPSTVLNPGEVFQTTTIYKLLK